MAPALACAPRSVPLAARRSSARAARAAVLARARRAGWHQWWSDSWDDGVEGWGLDGPLSPDAPPPPPAADALTTFFCCDGSVVQLGAQPAGGERLGAARRRLGGDSLPLPGEQGLCIGSLFRISATNGIEPSRRVSLAGFCFSTEQLLERVSDTVLARGGAVFETHRLLRSGVQEALVMTVAIPYLFGVPPEYERLKQGIKTGGGIIEKVERSWVIY